MKALALLSLVAVLQEKPAPSAFEARGVLVCLLEEMKEKYQAEAAPIHPHQYAFRVADKEAQGGWRYYTILRNSMSEALYADARFRTHELRLTGRIFPSSSVVELSRF